MINMYMNLYFLHVTVTCGVPPSPASGSVDFTNVIERSLATFRCTDMTAVCRARGSGSVMVLMLVGPQLL